MPKLTLTYFDFPGGRGEAERIALHLSGVDWVDNRLANADWKTVKPTTPFGGLPTLSVPDKGLLFESNAILGWIGEAYELLPADPFDNARHRAVMSAIEALRAEAATTGSPDEDTKRAKREAFAAGYFARWAASMSRQIRGPFVGGDTLSVADLKLYIAMRSYSEGVYDYIPADILEGFPAITTLAAAVAAHPGVKSWESRATAG